MNIKQAPPPSIAPETMRSLIKASSSFVAVKPWKLIYDSDLVGLTDPVTGETSLASVMGNGGEVFGVGIFRRPAGLRWILRMLNSPEDTTSAEAMEGMDAIKFEMVPKHELSKEELAVLKSLEFRPSGKGHVWPQFQSIQPGFIPWYIGQGEAEVLADVLARLTSFHALMEQHPNLMGERPETEIPFLPNPMPDRPLTLEDLDWRPMVIWPEVHEPFQPTAEQMAQISSLKSAPKVSYEYGCSIIPGSTVLKAGRGCYSRISLLIDPIQSKVLGSDLSLATQTLTESAGAGLVEALSNHGILPGTLKFDQVTLEPILKQMCDSLNIKLKFSPNLEALNDAMISIQEYMSGTAPR